MTVKELADRLRAIPNQDAEVLVEVLDPADPEAPDEYAIEEVKFMDWPEHYRKNGIEPSAAGPAKAEAYIRV